MSDEIHDLQREWRQIVLQKLETLERGLRRLEDDVVSIRTSFADGDKVKQLDHRVSSLEKDRARAMGIIIAFQVLIGIAIAWITRG